MFAYEGYAGYSWEMGHGGACGGSQRLSAVKRIGANYGDRELVVTLQMNRPQKVRNPGDPARPQNMTGASYNLHQTELFLKAICNVC